MLLLTTTAYGGTARSSGAPQPALIARISQHVFGSRWRTAACIAHYESTDGAHLYNWPNLGPWQIDVEAHRWVDQKRIVSNWWYAARVAYRLSSLVDRNHHVIPNTGGSNWLPWATHALCGV